MFSTPILLITFNRPSHTRKVFEVIRKQQPKQLFVFQDGARDNNDNDAIKCAEVRQVVKELVDWDCDLKTYYSDINLGCGHGPATAITWFFENVVEGIILEDDCIPHKDFFKYCQELLEKYRNSDKISFISGVNFQDGIQRGDGSYYFSLGNQATWGWATWKRNWDDFDYYLRGFSIKYFSNIIKTKMPSLRQRNYWLNIFEMTFEHRINETSWDYQFWFKSWEKDQLAIIPNVNLISNIGNDEEATHSMSSTMVHKDTFHILPLIHPTKIKHNIEADLYMQKVHITPYNYGWSGMKRFPYMINLMLKRKLGHKGPWINILK